MITWGWTRIDDHLPQCETIPLPAPKLSEQPFKANYLKNAKLKNPITLSNEWTIIEKENIGEDQLIIAEKGVECLQEL